MNRSSTKARSAPEKSDRRNVMKYQRKLISFAALALLPLITGCSSSSGGGGHSGGGSFPGMSGISLGSFVGGKNGQYLDAAVTALSAEGMTEEKQDEFGKAVAIGATNR